MSTKWYYLCELSLFIGESKPVRIPKCQKMEIKPVLLEIENNIIQFVATISDTT